MKSGHRVPSCIVIGLKGCLPEVLYGPGIIDRAHHSASIIMPLNVRYRERCISCRTAAFGGKRNVCFREGVLRSALTGQYGLRTYVYVKARYVDHASPVACPRTA